VGGDPALGEAQHLLDWFEVTSNLFYEKDNKASWFCAPQSSKEETARHSPAALQARDELLFFDEDSAIPMRFTALRKGDSRTESP